MKTNKYNNNIILFYLLYFQDFSRFNIKKIAICGLKQIV